MSSVENQSTSDIEEIIADIKDKMLSKILLVAGKDPNDATKQDWYVATALTLRDRIVDHWLRSNRSTQSHGQKRVYYLSLEFLIGRLLSDALSNLRLTEQFRIALQDFGIDLDELVTLEPDAALGNGGLGRLAACFMESMATLRIPAFGYGIRYEHGLFRQIIVDGKQEEFPEQWLRSGNPWEFERPEVTYKVGYGGTINRQLDPTGESRSVFWKPGETVLAVAYDTPVVGWGRNHVNALRLWSARAEDPLNIEKFNSGDHLGSMSESTRAQAISKFLYPSDETSAGRELRLKQEYFFISASLQDIISRHLHDDGDIETLATKAALQLNDTHPSLAVPEMMRLLMDEHQLSWNLAWQITRNSISYTNHTLLPEALETWQVDLLERLLPRHLDIIYAINVKNMEQADLLSPDDVRFKASVSLIDESGGRRVRMGHVAFVGSHCVNGVSAMHSELMKQTVFADLNRLYPNRISNKTNGITFRRWLHQCNPRLVSLLRSVCGDAVLDDPTRLRRLESLAEDQAFHAEFASVKLQNKKALASYVRDQTGIKIDATAMFDVQIKRIHEYKRQLLNAVEIVALYLAIKDNPHKGWTPRVKIFAGKAAASYQQAKLIIQFINDIASVINNDPATRSLLKVVFIPNYNVSAAERIIPACDLSEQISTAGMEASGTGNMKLALNGALTIGTLDGANIEIRDHVGEDNIFIFGMRADEVLRHRKVGLDSTDLIAGSDTLKRVLHVIEEGMFSASDATRFAPIVHALRHLDYYLVCADFSAYYTTQRHIDDIWNTSDWYRSAIMNVARMSWFSADRTIREYSEDIWNVPLMS